MTRSPSRRKGKIRNEIFKDHLQRESKHIFCRAIYSEVCAKIKMSRGICPPPLNRHLDVQLTTCLVSPRLSSKRGFEMHVCPYVSVHQCPSVSSCVHLNKKYMKSETFQVSKQRHTLSWHSKDQK